MVGPSGVTLRQFEINMIEHIEETLHVSIASLRASQAGVWWHVHGMGSHDAGCLIKDLPNDSVGFVLALVFTGEHLSMRVWQVWEILRDEFDCELYDFPGTLSVAARQYLRKLDWPGAKEV